MKKVLITMAAIVCLGTAAKAQDAGQMWVGGSIGFTNTDVKDGATSTSFNIIPQIGYAFSDKWAIGADLGYGHDKAQSGTKTDRFGIAPFARYSFLRGGVANLFVDMGGSYWHTKTKLEGGDSKTDRIRVGFRPGVSLNLSQHLAMTGTFGFVGYQHVKAGDAKTNTIQADFDLTAVQLGLNYRF